MKTMQTFALGGITVLFSATAVAAPGAVISGAECSVNDGGNSAVANVGNAVMAAAAVPAPQTFDQGGFTLRQRTFSVDDQKLAYDLFSFLKQANHDHEYDSRVFNSWNDLKREYGDSGIPEFDALAARMAAADGERRFDLLGHGIRKEDLLLIIKYSTPTWLDIPASALKGTGTDVFSVFNTRTRETTQATFNGNAAAIGTDFKGSDIHLLIGNAQAGDHLVISPFFGLHRSTWVPRDPFQVDLGPAQAPDASTRWQSIAMQGIKRLNSFDSRDPDYGANEMDREIAKRYADWIAYMKPPAPAPTPAPGSPIPAHIGTIPDYPYWSEIGTPDGYARMSSAGLLPTFPLQGASGGWSTDTLP